jgi:GST-like protein
VIDLYYFPSPNGIKAAIMLEECDLPFRVVPVDILRGEQFSAEYLRICPNNRIPAIVDHDTPGGPLSVFESGAVLVYLAEKAGRFLPTEAHGRFDVLQWLFWQVGGLGPMAGQAHHFRAFASEVVPYGIRRYTDEVNRLYGVLERRLSDRDYLAVAYSIADMACWPWVAQHARQGQELSDFPAVLRWFEAIRDRPAVQRVVSSSPERAADAQAQRWLYGQTAERVAELHREQGSRGDSS